MGIGKGWCGVGEGEEDKPPGSDRLCLRLILSGGRDKDTAVVVGSILGMYYVQTTIGAAPPLKGQYRDIVREELVRIPSSLSLLTCARIFRLLNTAKYDCA